jgi:hypothetical protein
MLALNCCAHGKAFIYVRLYSLTFQLFLGVWGMGFARALPKNAEGIEPSELSEALFKKIMEE